MADGARPDAEHRGRRAFRERRDDYAVELFREAREHLDDPARVDRLLFQLGRLYNPLRDEPIVDVATRKRVAELLGSARTEEACALLDARLALYAPPQAE